MSDPRLHLFGIRHHGPGSARALVRGLAELRPDLVLVEGPSDATALLSWLGHVEMEPPVALIVYRPDAPRRAATFPFALFSPEYQAVRYALARGIPVRLMDLPQSTMLAVDDPLAMPDGEALAALAKAAGYNSYERWWNHLIEQRRETAGLFGAVNELMLAARGALSSPQEPALLAPGVLLAERREATMREAIRTGLAEGRSRIALVCGAWHGPALTDPPRFADVDRGLLADLPHAPTECAWVPWSYGRLASFTGYGAGVPSPGWYHHLWEMSRHDAPPSDVTTVWLTRVGAMLREEGFDISAAHVIEAVRLAEALAALRGLSMPGLPELNDAALTTMSGGVDKPMQLIQRRLVVGERMGQVPADAPMTPLQRDLRSEQQRLRLRVEPELLRLQLDLRIEQHMDRSRLLHRLGLLRIPWGKLSATRGRGRGTFREDWQLQWQPELAGRVVEASVWGNSVLDAAVGFARHLAERAQTLADLTQLLDGVLLADLPDEIPHLMARIEEESVLHADVPHLMDALPPLVGILRYGTVRQIDRGAVQHAVESMLTRVSIGLPQVCTNVNDEAADELMKKVQQTHMLQGGLQNAEQSERWQGALRTIANDGHAHRLLAGRAVRLLFDGGRLRREEVAQRMQSAFGLDQVDAEALIQAGFWLDGFLRGADQLLVHDRGLWQVMDDWVMALESKRFLAVLPLLRRACSGYRDDARTELLARVRTRPVLAPQLPVRPGFDPEQAAWALPVLTEILLGGGAAPAGNGQEAIP